MPIRNDVSGEETHDAPAWDGTLTDEQSAAVERLVALPAAIQTLGGFAGTGKTTVIKTVKRELPRFAVCAFTGKAANVLRKKGIPATTIHSLIYLPEEEEYTDAKGRVRTRTVFHLKHPYLLGAEGFIVDEASMVGQKLHDDLRSFGRPIIFVGDHGQLEPVGDNSFNLMADPDVTLETVHRNAGEIAQFADFIRKGNTPGNWRRHADYTGEHVQFQTMEEAISRIDDDVHCYDQIIVAFNQTRVSFNEAIRDAAFGYPADHAVVGDRVMCLQNDHKRGVFNGMQGTVEGLFGDEMLFAADGETYRVRFIPEQFNQPKKAESRDRRGRLPFDYCYAVTCHKAQGDEFDSVLVLEQRCGAWSHARWCYTAASRARKTLVWIPQGRADT